MSFQAPNRTYTAGGTINQGTFVTLSEDFIVVQSTTGDSPIGVTDLGAVDFQSTHLAVSGQQVSVFGPAQECWLTLGSGGCNPNVPLKSDTSGNAIAASSTNKIGAWSLEGGSAGTLIHARVAATGELAP